MQIFEVGKNRFATGTIGKRADYVLGVTRGKFHGVRGQRPILEEGRYPKTAGNAEMRAAFTTATTPKPNKAAKPAAAKKAPKAKAVSKKAN